MGDEIEAAFRALVAALPAPLQAHAAAAAVVDPKDEDDPPPAGERPAADWKPVPGMAGMEGLERAVVDLTDTMAKRGPNIFAEPSIRRRCALAVALVLSAAQGAPPHRPTRRAPVGPGPEHASRRGARPHAGRAQAC